nr:MAG TPA: hypothetical protein [Caudoviricetes sp.]
MVAKYRQSVRYCTRCRYLSGEDKDTKVVQLNCDAETILVLRNPSKSYVLTM